jgi:hypothetical protein
MFKNFIIQEAVKNEHAARFMLFKERYHTQIFLDLKNELEKSWDKEVSKLIKKYKVSDDDAKFSVIQNPKTSTVISVESKAEKLTNPRYRESIEVSPSVKIPLIYKREERDLITGSILDVAEDAINKITTEWKEIFKIEKNGRSIPWFRIVRESDEIRFQLVISEGKQEMFKTLYSVRIDFGKVGSKIKDFDRIYLTSAI